MNSRKLIAGLLLTALAIGTAWLLLPADIGRDNRDSTASGLVPPEWTQQELDMILSLSLRNLPPLPVSVSNRYADSEAAAKLGQLLFFDPRLSSNGEVSCATCHQPGRDFSDGLPVGVGIAPVARHTMSLIGAGYSPWLFWDGRADSLWSQALGPLEDASEHGGTRTQYAHVIAEHYRDDYSAIFGETTDLEVVASLPAAAGPLGSVEQLTAWEQMTGRQQDAVNRVFANIGKAMEAYQRRLLPAESRFDAFARALAAGDRKQAEQLLSATEQHGLKLFVGTADCTHCHNGPLLSNNDFHNTAVATASEQTLGEGRARGVHRVRRSEFNCLGAYSDALPEDCGELQFVKDRGLELMSAFRTPGLRNVARTAPYMHNGRFATLSEVVDHYATAPDSVLGRSELLPLQLSDEQKSQLVAFLETLDEDIAAAHSAWRQPPPVGVRTALN